MEILLQHTFLLFLHKEYWKNLYNFVLCANLKKETALFDGSSAHGKEWNKRKQLLDVDYTQNTMNFRLS